LDEINSTENLVVRGINDEALIPHEPYFSDFLKTLFHSISTERVEMSLELIRSFHDMYVRLEFPIGYYRSFDPYSHFSFVNSNYSCVYEPNEEYKEILDIRVNLHIIRELYRIVSMIALSKR
jgi:hypothetical protein